MKNHDLIDRYFENSLSPKEQKLFNDLLQNNSEFLTEFEFQKDLKKIIAVKQQEDLKSTLIQIEKRSQKNSRLMLIPKKWVVAASFLILTSLGIWGIQSKYFPSNEAIYADYFEPSRNIVQPIVRGENLNTIEYRAFVAYEAQNYHKAINLFNSVKNPDQVYIDFYKGICFLAINKPEESIDLLKPVSHTNDLNNKHKGFNKKAKWYLSLAYVKINDNQNAIKELTEIINDPSENIRKDAANEILEFLD
jgi:tetratricopeptide (TPR) repeat protein